MSKLDTIGGPGESGEEKENTKTDVISKDETAEGGNENAKELEFERRRDDIIEKCGKSLNYVFDIYDNSNLAENKDKLDKLKSHIGKEVLVFAVEEAVKRGLDDENCYLVGISACLHDAGKAVAIPDNLKEVKGPVIEVYHHVLSCDLIENDKETIRGMLRDGYPSDNKDELNDELLDEKIEIIKDAIMSHMGPNPGFMKDMLDNVVNPQLGYGDKIEHLSPNQDNVVAQILLAADMYSLANPRGVEKILELRGDIVGAPFFQKEDFELCYEYNRISKKYKKDLLITVGEAAFISAYKSGLSARDMFDEDTKDREWIEGAIDDVENTEKFIYTFKKKDSNGESKKIEMIIDPEKTIEKMENYNKLVHEDKIAGGDEDKRQEIRGGIEDIKT